MVFLGFQGICTKVEIFMVLVRVMTKRGGDQRSLITASDG